MTDPQTQRHGRQPGYARCARLLSDLESSLERPSGRGTAWTQDVQQCCETASGALRSRLERPDSGLYRELPRAKPRLARRTNIFKGFPEKKFPPITGFVETKARKKADTDLFIPLPDGSRKPLVASWRYGKGKAVVFTTDLEGGWTRGWIRWRGLDRFI